METLLHTYNDGSLLVKTNIQKVLQIPIWKGNRIIIRDHIEEIAREVQNNLQFLDSGYHCIVYPEIDAIGNLIEQRYLVDGQHRAEVIRQHLDACKETHLQMTGASCNIVLDFPCTMRIKRVESESEAIEYFNAINNAKPIRFDADPNLLINEFLLQLEKAFPKKRIRQTKTKRPYLYVGDIRQKLLPHVDKLTKSRIPQIIRAIQQWNEAECANQRADSVGEKCHELQFFLAYYPDLRWIRETIH